MRAAVDDIPDGGALGVGARHRQRHRSIILFRRRETRVGQSALCVVQMIDRGVF
jgi:hypothetical protein